VGSAAPAAAAGGTAAAAVAPAGGGAVSVWLGPVAESDEEQGGVAPVALPAAAAETPVKGSGTAGSGLLTWAKACCSQCRPTVKVSTGVGPPGTWLHKCVNYVL
jgi:hypothetical protein